MKNLHKYNSRSCSKLKTSGGNRQAANYTKLCNLLYQLFLSVEVHRYKFIISYTPTFAEKHKINKRKTEVILPSLLWFASNQVVDIDKRERLSYDPHYFILIFKQQVCRSSMLLKFRRNFSAIEVFSRAEVWSKNWIALSVVGMRL